MHIADELNRQLSLHANVVVTAPPGAGKSTLLPLTILRQLDEGKIYVLEPRRLAARQIAERMAWMIGEEVGRTVGYRVRFESRVSPDTRIEVLTEGILTRMLVDDPMLEEASVVIFDEFHERSLNSDVALALTREVQQVIRPDLRLVIMSATIDTTLICSQLQAPLVESEGRMFPVGLRYAGDLPLTDHREALRQVARTVIQAHRTDEGDILVFLPGEAEIRLCQELLEGALDERTAVCPLYGMLTPQQQRQAIQPSPEGWRKVVLATSIAETSLTIEGVRVVVDMGLQRRMLFDARTGMSHLETVPVSLDMARQRSGRAGRLAPGICYRLWSKASESRMAEHRTPEIEEADLSPMMLEICAWGESNLEGLPWLTMPPRAHLIQASTLLRQLQAMDDGGQLTAHGRRLVKLPCHPRIAQMILLAQGPAEQLLAADMAALLESPATSLPRTSGRQSADIDDLLEELRLMRGRRGQARGGWERVLRASDYYLDLARRIHATRPSGKAEADRSSTHPSGKADDPRPSGYFLAAAYPERIAMRMKEGVGQYRLASGAHAVMDASEELSAHPWIAVAHLNATREGRIFLAASVDEGLLSHFAVERDYLLWDNKQGCVVASHDRRIGTLVLSSRPAREVSREQMDQVICEAVRKWGTSMLDFSDEVLSLQLRIATAAQWHPALDLPDVSTPALLESASRWLPLYLGRSTTTAELKKIPLAQAVWGILGYEQQQALERIVPTHIQLPSGRRAKVEYRPGAELPIVRARIQDCFGMQDTPRVDNGQRPVLMELLSPGFKPVQLTQDLRNFWAETYFEVRKELRRRYPKHSWPDNPAAAT